MTILIETLSHTFSIFIAAMYALPGDEAVVKVKRGETELEFTLIYQETDWKKLQRSVESSQNRGR